MTKIERFGFDKRILDFKNTPCTLLPADFRFSLMIYLSINGRFHCSKSIFVQTLVKWGCLYGVVTLWVKLKFSMKCKCLTSLISSKGYPSNSKTQLLIITVLFFETPPPLVHVRSSKIIIILCTESIARSQTSCQTHNQKEFWTLFMHTIQPILMMSF